MKKHIALLGLVLLAACSPDEEVDQNDDAMTGTGTQNMVIEYGDSSSSVDAMVQGTGGTMQESSSPDAQLQGANYLTYSDDVLMNGEPKILFFHAAWCPICRDADEKLMEWYGQQLPTINVYKVDYDTQADLKAKYGVTYQHTFVLVDGEGNAIQKVQGPSDTALQALIGA